MRYMCVQKLRTPGGLAAVKEEERLGDANSVLFRLQEYQKVFGATWSECVWQIADASRSATKLIVTDHPVTVYNRDRFPGGEACRGFRDPDIRLVATHTLFALSMEKVLILTNLAWARDPYQRPDAFRPNRGRFRSTVFSFLRIQTHRFLSEEEVVEINFVLKKRAL